MTVYGVDQWGDVVFAYEVETAESICCPECESEFDHRRDRHSRDGYTVSATFVHPSDSSSCGGESDYHKRMKGVAAAAADNRYSAADVSIESSISDRDADVLVSFQQRHERLGDGIAIECQYKNQSKDIAATETDYAAEGYSTLWLYPEAFDGFSVDLCSGRFRYWWPTAVPSTEQWSGVLELQSPHWSVEFEPPHTDWIKDFDHIYGPVSASFFSGKKVHRRQQRQQRQRRERRRRRTKDSDLDPHNERTVQEAVTEHRSRYEGWDENSAPIGEVKRFDKQIYQWVSLDLSNIPARVRQDRRAGGEQS